MRRLEAAQRRSGQGHGDRVAQRHQGTARGTDGGPVERQEKRQEQGETRQRARHVGGRGGNQHEQEDGEQGGPPVGSGDARHSGEQCHAQQQGDTRIDDPEVLGIGHAEDDRVQERHAAERQDPTLAVGIRPEGACLDHLGGKHEVGLQIVVIVEMRRTDGGGVAGGQHREGGASERTQQPIASCATDCREKRSREAPAPTIDVPGQQRQSGCEKQQDAERADGLRQIEQASHQQGERESPAGVQAPVDDATSEHEPVDRGSPAGPGGQQDQPEAEHAGESQCHSGWAGAITGQALRWVVRCGPGGRAPSGLRPFGRRRNRP